ncbi:MAG: biotin--[acetyl-CoA-carboxylase] ligase [Salinivirgaceae bacterium]|jgi:BirA family biotin operon repressor/biotin-[acetyl-CoA-carboxylase] ligase|nr:biotin--[acetyl-CoA-carboxylase] ligase [Salinivirgaceae bacterium]
MITFNIEVKHELASTNDYLKNIIAEQDTAEGFVILAKHQIDGRGQGENKWESEKNKNLTFSLLLRPSFLPAGDMFMISKTVALGILDYLNSLDKNFSIKWPNDFYFGDKKIGGILIENQLLGCCLNYSFIGIGLNINQVTFLSNAPNPISLKNILNKELEIGTCLNDLLASVNKWYDYLKDGLFDKINKQYFVNLYRNEGYYKYKTENDKFSAKIISVESDGKLNLKTTEGKLRSFYFKEVEFML